MKRGIPKQVGTIVKPVTYTYDRSLLLKKLGLPPDARLYVHTDVVGGMSEVILDNKLCVLLVDCKETVTSRAPKVAGAHDEDRAAPWIAKCGLVVPSYAKLEAHQASCSKCGEAKVATLPLAGVA